jgi:hypothetical protein
VGPNIDLESVKKRRNLLPLPGIEETENLSLEPKTKKLRGLSPQAMSHENKNI